MPDSDLMTLHDWLGTPAPTEEGQSAPVPAPQWLGSESPAPAPVPLHQWLAPTASAPQPPVQPQNGADARGKAFAAEHPYAAAGLELGEESGIAPAMRGIKRLFGTDATSPQEGANVSLENTGVPAVTAGKYAGKAAGFLTNLSPGLGGALSAAGAYGEGESALQAGAHGAVNYAIGHLLGKGLSDEFAAPIQKALSGIAPKLVAKVGARAAAGALIQAGNVAANNAIAGKPLTEGMLEAATVGGVLEPTVGYLHDTALDSAAKAKLAALKGASTSGPTSGIALPPTVKPEQLRAEAVQPGEPDEVTRLREENANLRKIAFQDEVTKGPNRAAFRTALPDILKSADEKNIPIANVEHDITGFKELQDNKQLGIGHEGGDRLLELGHESLMEGLRTQRPGDLPPDNVFRVGGDEFRSILHNVDDPAKVDIAMKRVNDLYSKKVGEAFPQIPPDLRPQIAWGSEIRQPGDTRGFDEIQHTADLKVGANKSALKAARGLPEGRAEYQQYLNDRLGPPKGEPTETDETTPARTAAAAVSSSLPPASVPADTFPHRVLQTISRLYKDEAGTARIRLHIMGGKSMGDILGGTWQDITRGLAKFAGGEVGRGRGEKEIMNAIQKADSTTNQIALRNEAARKPYIDTFRKLPKDQQIRLVDELDSGQQVSDPAFRGYQKLHNEHGKDLIDGLKSIGVNTTGMSPYRVLRNFADTDEAGHAPWQADYKGPSKGVRGGSLEGNWVNYSRKIESYADSLKVNQDAGRVEKYPDALTGHMAKQGDVWQKINAKRMAMDELAAGHIRELNPGDKIQVGEHELDDKMFHPFPRKFAAPGALAAKMNDVNVPFRERLATFRQAMKDGTLKETSGANEDAAELYREGIHKEPGFQKEGEIRERYKQGSPHATGEYTQGAKFSTGYEQTESHTTGQYKQAWSGNLPEGHMLVDDALAQADRRRYVAQGPNADILNNHLQPPPVDPKGALAKTWNFINHTANMARIGLSGMHYLSLRGGAIAERRGYALEQAVKGNFGEAGKALAQTVPVKDMYDMIKAGQTLKQAIADPLAHPEMQEEVEQIRKAGGIIDRPKLTEQEEKPVNPLNPLSIFQLNQKLLFDKYGNPAMNGAMHLAVKSEMDAAYKAGKSLNDPDVQARIKNAVNSTMDVFDTIRKDRNFQDNVSRTAMKAVFAFPNWTLSKMRLGARAVGDIPEAFKTGSMTPAQRIMVGNLMSTALTGGVMTWASTGKPPQSAKDFFYPVLPGGERVVMPGPLLPLISLAIGAESTGQWIENRMNPAIQIATQLAQNKDYRNVHTRDSMGDAVKFIGNNVAPSFIQSAGDNKENLLQKIGDFFGIRKASERLNWTPAETEAHDILANKSEVGGRTIKEYQHSQQMNDFVDGIRNGTPGTRQEIQKAAERGDISDEDRKNIFKYAKEHTAILELLKRKEIAPEDIMRIWAKMSPTERDQSRAFARSKIANARSTPPRDRRLMLQTVGD